MTATSANLGTLEVLVAARKVADLAASEGLDTDPREMRRSYDHLGALLADSVLQAGLNYSSVVRPRVNRILAEYAQANTTDALQMIVATGSTGVFLAWQHPTKIARFERLVHSLHEASVKDVADLRFRLVDECFCVQLQDLNGVGPKTVDYMACLVGIDSVAIDRHIKNYARRAGVVTVDYSFLKRVFCFAADLLEISRREFDAWIWRRESEKKSKQLSLNFV